jgi:hypothetical protein
LLTKIFLSLKAARPNAFAGINAAHFLLCSFLLVQKRTKKGHPRMIFSTFAGSALIELFVLMILQQLGLDA